MKGKKNGYSIGSDKQLNEKLNVLVRMLGANSIRQVLNVMLECPELNDFLFDRFRATAFNFSPEQKQAYEKEHKIEASGLKKYLVVPSNIGVIKNE